MNGDGTEVTPLADEVEGDNGPPWPTNLVAGRHEDRHLDHF
jgi:hypothetical protein